LKLILKIKLRKFEVKKRVYAISKEIKDKPILFIGTNLSYGKKDKPFIFFYPTDNSQAQHQYFKKFKDIANYCNIYFSHLDLLFFR
jgi:hypothetical protein